LFRNEAPCHRFIEAASRGSTPYSSFHELRTGGSRLGNAGRAVERHRWHQIVPCDPGHFLDQVRRTFDVAAPAWDRDPVALYLETEASQNIALPVLGHIDPAERFRAAEVEGYRPLFDRWM